jgi:gamma-tubulin complex component 2
LWLLFLLVQITAHRAKKKIAESSKTPVEFLQKYDELKSRKYENVHSFHLYHSLTFIFSVRELDSLTNLLSLISEDEAVSSK